MEGRGWRRGRAAKRKKEMRGKDGERMGQDKENCLGEDKEDCLMTTMNMSQRFFGHCKIRQIISDDSQVPQRDHRDS